MKSMLRNLILICILLLMVSACNSGPKQLDKMTKEEFISDLKFRTFNYFWYVIDTPTMQTPDRYPTNNFSSIAATGFAFPAYIIGIENKFISRQEGAERVLATLRWLLKSKQGPEAEGVTGYKGFYYHFLNYGSGTRFKTVELSTIDTGLLMAGILTSMTYFDADNAVENEIRSIADSLYKRVEWDWAMNGREFMSMGWHPERGFLSSEWTGYNEAMILLLMAMGSPTHPIADSSWNSWCKNYQWAGEGNLAHVNFEPLFGHQYSHMFVDFKGISDEYMKNKGIDYFENSRRATLYNRDYCIRNPNNFKGYSENVWGLTACDGPADVKQIVGKDSVQFFSYRARGASYLHVVDDGTIAPTAAGGSIPFAPDECLNALYTIYNMYGDKMYHEYGFKDAFNLTYENAQLNQQGWFDPDYLGIDQGPILIQLENHQTGLIWSILKRNKYIVSGLKKAGFTGGWLENEI